LRVIFRVAYYRCMRSRTCAFQSCSLQ